MDTIHGVVESRIAGSFFACFLYASTSLLRLRGVDDVLMTLGDRRLSRWRGSAMSER